MSQEQKKELNIFQARQLATFSPYRVTSLETRVKNAEVRDKTSGKVLRTFPSKNHTITIIPQKNDKVSMKVNIYDQDYQQMLALAELYGGFENCWLTAVIDNSSTSTKLKIQYTAEQRA